MGIVNWLFERKTKMVTVDLPTPIAYALETLVYMQNANREEDDQLSRDDIVTIALATYMQKNLWTNTIDGYDVVAKLHKRDISYEDHTLKSNRTNSR